MEWGAEVIMKPGYFELRSEVVRAILLREDMRQWWVAERVGVHKTTLRRWLSGEIGAVHQENLARLADVLCTSLSEITRSG